MDCPKEFDVKKILTLDEDHWSQPSAARTILGLIRAVNEYDGKVIVEMKRSTRNLNIFVNCNEEMVTQLRLHPLDQSMLEIGMSQNFAEFLLPYDLEIDIK